MCLVPAKVAMPMDHHTNSIPLLQSGLGQGQLAAASQDKRSDDVQGILRRAQASLGKWQQSLADLIPSPSGRLEAETVR